MGTKKKRVSNYPIKTVLSGLIPIMLKKYHGHCLNEQKGPLLNTFLEFISD